MLKHIVSLIFLTMVGNMYLRNIYPRYCNRLLCTVKPTFRVNKIQWTSSKSEKSTAVKDKPIPYLSSEAGKWKALYTNTGDKFLQNRPDSESTAIVLSISALLIYFCILREENDLDDWLREVETVVPIQVQEYQLRTEIVQGIKQGRDVKQLKVRLAELLKEKQDGAKS